MSALSIPNTFVASTTIIASQMNANFSAVTSVINGSLDNTNFGTLSGVVTWSISSNVLAQSVVSSSTAGVFSASATGVLAAGKSVIGFVSGANQTTGDGGASFQFTSASSTIPVVLSQNAGSGAGIQSTSTGSGPAFKAVQSGAGTLMTCTDGSTTVLEFDKTGLMTQGNIRQIGWNSNLGLARATTTNANDSLKITGANGSALSASNPAYVCLPSATLGQATIFKITADVTMLLSGCVWGWDTLGDLTGAIVRLYAINDAGTLKWGLAEQGGFTSIKVAQSSITAASINASEKVFVNSTLTGTSACFDIGYCFANFTDSTNVWAIQGNVDSLIIGRNADGVWQPYNPSFTGVTANPTGDFRWTSHGRMATLTSCNASLMSSNSSNKTQIMPVKSNYQAYFNLSSGGYNNGVFNVGIGPYISSANTNVLSFLLNGALAGFSGSGGCQFPCTVAFEMYQP